MANRDTPLPIERIERLILMLRGHRVILDKDLAALYGVTTGSLNKAVSRNIERFPGDFMLQLTGEDLRNLKFHFGTSSLGGHPKTGHSWTPQNRPPRG